MRRLVLIVFLSTLSAAQFQNAELTAQDGQKDDELGVALSVSGSIAASVTAFGSSGSVYLFSGSADWTTSQQIAKLQASDGSKLTAVSISGSVVVASRLGQAYVFVEPQSGWADATETAVLTASDGQSTDNFGASVAIDGSTIIVGSPLHNSSGAVYVYVQPQSGWHNATESGQLTQSKGVRDDFFGYSIAISGQSIAATAGSGLYVFQQPANGWGSMTETARLSLPKPAHCQNSFWGPVAIYAGTIVAAGVHCDVKSQQWGAGYVYNQPAKGWVNALPNAVLTLKGTLCCGWPFVNPNSVAIDADTIVIGSNSRVNKWQLWFGSAFVFFEPVTGWKSATQNMRIVPKYQNTGAGMSVSAEPGFAFIGAPATTVGSNYAQGAVFVETAKHP